MKTRRFGVAAVGLIALATLATGCKSTGQPGASTSASTSASASAPAQTAAAAEALAAAAGKLKQTTAKMTMTMSAGVAGANVTGRLDGPGRKTASTMDVMGMKMEFVQIADEVWLKAADVPGMPKGWMHIDVTKLGPQSSLRKSLEDPSYSSKMLATATQVQWDGTGKVKGVLDLSQAPSVNSSMAATLGEKVKAVPFTATIDDQGRLTSVTVALGELAPTAGLGDMKIGYSDFGAPVTIDKPTGEIVEAPAAVLAAL
ncbi:hypothetical protein [Catellatospora sichuanensis]|uniref:hypothetical protein n=1 Tax=Catellatospora sichuanensis TaxID=1969805 RepID=UPI001183FDFA|nr:hypothetical protein [Catellatospora sichuanensis]